MSRVLIASLALLLGGCAVVQDRETLKEEAVFAVAHALDGAQTAQIQHTPGIVEREWAWTIGAKPSTRSTAAYFAGSEVLHVAAADYMLAHHWPRWTLRTFEALTIADASQDVVSNAYLGLDIRF